MFCMDDLLSLVLRWRSGDELCRLVVDNEYLAVTQCPVGFTRFGQERMQCVTPFRLGVAGRLHVRHERAIKEFQTAGYRFWYGGYVIDHLLSRRPLPGEPVPAGLHHRPRPRRRVLAVTPDP